MFLSKNYLLGWVAMSVFFSLIALLDPFPTLRNRASDLWFVPQAPSGNIVLLKIDDESLNKIGHWPWPRETIARLIQTLDDASVIGIDITFKEPSRLGDRDDIVLENTFKNLNTPVVLATDIETKDKIAYPLRRFVQYTHPGFSNIIVDSDGVVRRIEKGRSGILSFAGAVSALHKRRTLSSETLLGSEDLVRIHYRGPNNTYPSFSAIDVLNNKVPKSWIEGRIVLIGVTASDVKNFYQTPFGLMSGLEIQANAIDTLLGEILYTFNPWVSVGVIFALSFIVIWTSIRIRNAFLILLVLLGLFAFYSAAAFISFGNFFILDLVYPGLAIIGTSLIFNTSQYIAAARREQNVRKSLNYLKAMVESMVEGIIMTDTQYRITIINPAAKQILALSPSAEEASINLSAIGDKKYRVKELLKKSLVSDKILKLDEVLIGDRFFQIFTAPVKTATGDLLGGIIIFHDITPEKEVEKIREDYTSMLVHELRSPLDGIKKMTAVMLENDSFAKQEDLDKKYKMLIHDGATQMLELVNNLLDVAKIEAGKFKIYKEPSSIKQVVENRINFFQASAQSAKIQLTARYGKNIPEKINFDPVRISQVLNNLISNALKFAGSGGKIVIDIFYHRKGNEVEEELKRQEAFPLLNKKLNKAANSLIVAVSNTGPAIPREILPQLFSKFKQFAIDRKIRAKGTGLGLVIAKGIVEEHGGFIGAESQEGVGTTFYFTIPDPPPTSS